MGCPLSLHFPEASSFNFYFILQDNLLTILYEFQVYSKVIKLHIDFTSLHICIIFFFRGFPRWLGLPGGLPGKESACNAGDLGSIPGLGRALGEGNGYPFQLEKEMATHSSILVWRIPWTEEPGGLQSMGLQSVGHN